jgi:hypothetical protein
MAQERLTNYPKDTILEIVETTFHDYPLGTKVKVVGWDWFSYQVVNITDIRKDKRWWWVNENQVKPILTK